MESTQKKGMSKGCLVGIIIAAVLVVIIIIGIALIYFYKEDIGKFGAVTVAQGIKTELADNPVDGIDTTRVHAVVDAFVKRVNEEEADNLVTLSAFMQTVQPMISDQELDSAEVEMTIEAMIDVYPELDTIWRPHELEETGSEDSLTTE
jgi:hypothetical protein